MAEKRPRKMLNFCFPVFSKRVWRNFSHILRPGWRASWTKHGSHPLQQEDSEAELHKPLTWPSYSSLHFTPRWLVSAEAPLPVHLLLNSQGATCIGEECCKIIECEGCILSIWLDPWEAAEASGMLNILLSNSRARSPCEDWFLVSISQDLSLKYERPK